MTARPRAQHSHLDIHFSDFFDVSPDDLHAYGAFNISLLNDLPLFVDPFLLFNSDKPVYRQLHENIVTYMRFLREMSTTDHIDRGLLTAWFRFPEIRQNWLGFSESGNEGHGLGPRFADSLHRNLRSIFRDFGDETVTRDSHIEKLSLLERGVGRDNISDFTTNLIVGFLAEYTQQFAQDNISADLCANFAVQKVEFNYDTRSWVGGTFRLPRYQNDFVLLTPKDILTKDEAWINRTELLDRLSDIASSLSDETLRAQVNEYLLRTLPRGPSVGSREVHEALNRVLQRFPNLLDYYIRDKEQHADQATSVARERVAEVQTIFVDQVRQLTHELLSHTDFYESEGETYAEARRRLLFLKDVVENKGGHHLFYIKGKALEREKDLHILYRLTWFATPSDVGREVDDGRGPADFKVSRGAHDKTLVEFKLAKNSQLERNLEKQAEIYEKASDATRPTLKAIFYFNEEQLDRVRRILERLKLQTSPHVILIDARADNKPSGSRA